MLKLVYRSLALISVYTSAIYAVSACDAACGNAM